MLLKILFTVSKQRRVHSVSIFCNTRDDIFFELLAKNIEMPYLSIYDISDINMAQGSQDQISFSFCYSSK